MTKKFLVVIIIVGLIIGGIITWKYCKVPFRELLGLPKTSVIEVYGKDSGSIIEVTEADSIVITLRNPGDGGYVFDEPEFDPSVLELESHEHLPPLTPKPGDFGSDRWKFRVLRPKESKIEIYIYQPWKEEEKKLDFVLNIVPK